MHRLFCAVICALLINAALPAAETRYRSPYDAAWSPDGRLLAVSDRTANNVTLFSGERIAGQAALEAQAGAVAWKPDGSGLYVTEYQKHAVAEINPADGKIVRRIRVGAYPIGLAVAARRGLLIVGNTGSHDLSLIDLNTGKESGRVPCLREPFSIAVSADESLAVVGNLLPVGSAADPRISTCLSIIDLNTLQRTDVKLPPNSACIRHVAVSPDGKWAYAVHTLGRTTLPATQLERGWVNTNALSIIDLTGKNHYATVLIDNLTQGSADPWGIQLSKDGQTMWISIAGTHQVAKVDIGTLHKCLAGTPPESAMASSKHSTTQSVWARIKADPKVRAELVNDLTALYMANVMTRINLPGKGPRGMALSPDGKQLAVGMYFSGQVLLLDTATSRLAATLSMGDQPEADIVRRGESIFHDARYAFQQWLSCATCHPNEGRVDGMNWDLPNDGIGNPKNNKSLLFAHLTPPSMSMGIREDMDAAAAAGFRFAALQPPTEDVEATRAYIRSLSPLASPHRLPDGGLSEKARRGQAIFNSEATHCAGCHSGELFTNLKQYDVGTQGPLDHKEHKVFDTPTLIELWRTAPYLHDGRATTLHELFTKYNPDDRHGATSKLSPDQLDDLVEFLLSL